MGKEERELLTDILEELRFISNTLMHHFPSPPPAREPTPQEPISSAPGTIPIDLRRHTVGSGGGWSMTTNSMTAQIYTFSGLGQPPEEGNAGVMAYAGLGGGGSGSSGAEVTIEDLVEGFAVESDLAGLLRRLGQARPA